MTPLLFTTLLCLGAPGDAGSAFDWPQWRGPERTGISRETRLLKSFPKDGPKRLWTFEQTGIGYSGPAIVGNRLYILGAPGEADEQKPFLLCLDVTNGQELWRQEFGKGYPNNWGGGPRSTPTVDGQAVYVLGPNGELVCFGAAKGEIRWQKNLVTDLGGEQMIAGKNVTWGYSESPLIDGDWLIVTPGGAKGTLAALNKTTGEVIWRSKDLKDPAAYSSVMTTQAGGIKQYVVLTGKAVAGVAAKDGRLLWRHENTGYRVAVIATPIISDPYVYVTADYEAGCDLVKLKADGKSGVKAETVYGPNKVMQNHHGGVILFQGHLFGWTGNTNSRGRWLCQNLESGKEVWSSEKLDAGSVILADGSFWCYGQKNGTLVRIKASLQGWEEEGRFTIPQETKINRKQGKIWTHPVIANGRLYLRDQNLLFCFDVKAP